MSKQSSDRSSMGENTFNLEVQRSMRERVEMYATMLGLISAIAAGGWWLYSKPSRSEVDSQIKESIIQHSKHPHPSTIDLIKTSVPSMTAFEVLKSDVKAQSHAAARLERKIDRMSKKVDKIFEWRFRRRRRNGKR